MKNVQIDHSMAMEFITCLLRCATNDDFADYVKENSYLQNEAIKEYLQEAEKRMSIFLKRDLEVLIKDFRINFYYPAMLIADKNIQSVEEFLDFFKKINGKDYLKQFIGLYALDISISSNDTEILEKVTELRSKKEAELLIEFKANPEEMKKRLDDLFEGFYTQVFSKYESGIKAGIDTTIKEHQIIFEKDVKGFLKNIGNGDYSKALNDPHNFKVYICYLEEFTVRYMFYGDTHMFIYGFSEIQKFQRKELENQSQEVFKTLSDQTRLDILRLLSQEKWYRSHLVKHLGLTSATMTYHLNKLITLGIIKVEINEENRNTQYILDKEKLKNLVNRATEDILKVKI